MSYGTMCRCDGMGATLLSATRCNSTRRCVWGRRGAQNAVQSGMTATPSLPSTPRHQGNSRASHQRSIGRICGVLHPVHAMRVQRPTCRLGAVALGHAPHMAPMAWHGAHADSVPSLPRLTALPPLPAASPTQRPCGIPPRGTLRPAGRGRHPRPGRAGEGVSGLREWRHDAGRLHS